MEKNVEDGLEAYRRGNCDGVIGLGGGSPLDAAKAIRLVATHPFPLEQYDDQLDGAARIHANVPPMIAIATTAGTGSEVGRSTVIILEATDRKTVIFSPHLMPNVALADPELTLGMPPKITAGTGLDALTHNVEAYLALGYHPLCDAIALQGAKLAIQNLPRAVQDGNDLEARSNMMMAAMMGAVAFQKGLGAVHSLAHPLSSIAHLHHGTTNGILLPHVLEFNRSVLPKDACAILPSPWRLTAPRGRPPKPPLRLSRGCANSCRKSAFPPPRRARGDPRPDSAARQESHGGRLPPVESPPVHRS